MQCLGADDDLRRRHVDRVRIPAGGGRSAPHTHEVGEVGAAAVGDAVLAIAGEDEVIAAESPARTDLRGLLAEKGRPQAQLALALQCGRLGVDSADDHHVLVQREKLLVADVGHPRVVARIGETGPVGSQELNGVDVAQMERPELDLIHALGRLGGIDAFVDRNGASGNILG